jgi:hypothetical protein
MLRSAVFISLQTFTVALMMGAASILETSVKFDQATQHKILDI